MLEQLRLIAEALPWTVPALIGGGILGLLTMVLFPRRRSRSDRVGFALFTWCIVVALVVTLSPVKNFYFGVPTEGCNLNVWRPLSYHYWFSAGSRPPNVWLLLPAGIGAVLIDGFFRRVLALGFLVALPPGIEAVQDYYPELKRSCSSQDIVDNWTGLAIGVAIGLVLMVFIGIARLIRRRSRRRAEALGYAEHVEEPWDAPMPLGGGRSGGYDDFSDFDDTPNSTRWWSADQPTQAAPQQAWDSRDEETRAAPRRANAAWEAGSDESADSTRVMPTRPGRHDDRGDSDGDITQIIRRR